MAVTTKIIGTVPVSRGAYQSGTSYYKSNRVTLYGCEFESKHDGNTTVPATLSADGLSINFNTTDWLVTSNGSDAYLADAKMQHMQDQINALASGLKVSLSVSPTVIHKNTATTVTITGSVTPATNKGTLIIRQGSTVVTQGTNIASIEGTQSVNDSQNTREYLLEATINGMTMTANASVNLRYPVYCGFGTSASAVAVSANMMSPRTSAAGTYSKTSTSAGSFYILVPSDIPGLSQFVMNGAPFVMLDPVNTILSGVNYKVYESANSYNAGTELTIEVR